VTLRIEQALDLILKDLEAGGVPLPGIDWSDSWQDWQPSESVGLGGTGVWLNLTLTEAEGVAVVADQVQDWAVEELWRRRKPSNWPVCPAHPATHPMKAVVLVGEAVWVCPAGGEGKTQIGELGGRYVRPDWPPSWCAEAGAQPVPADSQPTTSSHALDPRRSSSQRATKCAPSRSNQL
jgi:hypothetical protein